MFFTACRYNDVSMKYSHGSQGAVPPGLSLFVSVTEVQSSLVHSQQLADAVVPVKLPVFIHHLRKSGISWSNTWKWNNLSVSFWSFLNQTKWHDPLQQWHTEWEYGCETESLMLVLVCYWFERKSVTFIHPMSNFNSYCLNWEYITIKTYNVNIYIFEKWLIWLVRVCRRWSRHIPSASQTYPSSCWGKTWKSKNKSLMRYISCKVALCVNWNTADLVSHSAVVKGCNGHVLLQWLIS